MDWFASIDLYCERIGPGLWAEPLNALSNAAFFVAALVAGWHAWHSPARRDGLLWLLIALVAAIGAGSTAFHIVAQRWAMAADVLPITLFTYAFFLFAMRRFAGLGWAWASLTTLAFLVGSFFTVLVPRHVMNGSVGYLPAFLAMSGVGLLLMGRRHPAGAWLGAAGAVFLVSLMFRSIDQAVCPLFPWGVHYLWHVLNGVVLWMLLEAGARYGSWEPGRRPG
ncbi:hypothetical protein FHS85_002073 [Rhodoligotrophos appendicifer]|uniref:ceramidase domain-containing protein n=1 Tax=Rhodoligotrophos appendicifer TaxID=987056 RepID=UPI001184FC38|nr:ceramidase domain-containing protein [Rhodoligotrophos appendicifer]